MRRTAASVESTVVGEPKHHASTAVIVSNWLAFLCLGTATVTLLLQAIRYAGPVSSFDSMFKYSLYGVHVTDMVESAKSEPPGSLARKYRFDKPGMPRYRCSSAMLLQFAAAEITHALTLRTRGRVERKSITTDSARKECSPFLST